MRVRFLLGLLMDLIDIIVDYLREHGFRNARVGPCSYYVQEHAIGVFVCGDGLVISGIGREQYWPYADPTFFDLVDALLAVKGLDDLHRVLGHGYGKECRRRMDGATRVTRFF